MITAVVFITCPFVVVLVVVVVVVVIEVDIGVVALAVVAAVIVVVGVVVVSVVVKVGQAAMLSCVLPLPLRQRQVLLWVRDGLGWSVRCCVGVLWKGVGCNSGMQRLVLLVSGVSQ